MDSYLGDCCRLLCSPGELGQSLWFSLLQQAQGGVLHQDVAVWAVPVEQPRRQFGLFGRPIAARSLPPLGLCFPICTVETWQCLGQLHPLVPGQDNGSVNSYVTEHSQVALTGDQLVTPRHSWMLQSLRLPSLLVRLGIEHSVK